MYRLAAVEFPRDRFPVGGYWYSMVFCVRFEVRYMWVKVFFGCPERFCRRKKSCPCRHTYLLAYLRTCTQTDDAQQDLWRNDQVPVPYLT